ncbi:MAG: SRPBCC family protein, partial [Candidatus Binataceae bacterium]
MKSTPESARDRVVSVRRTFHASRAFLFRAWTDPARYVQWFGPKAWTVERCEIDARPAGAWRAWLKRGDGASVVVSGDYTEFDPDHRIAFTWNAEGGQPDTSSLVTVEFRDCLGGVEISLTHRELPTGRAVDMDVGWNSTLDSLEEYVRTEPDYPFVSTM